MAEREPVVVMAPDRNAIAPEGRMADWAATFATRLSCIYAEVELKVAG